VANALTTLMVTVAKIAADIRLLSSGPLAGLGELRIPAVQVGSSCMPGKVNPVMPELVMQVSYEIRGRRHIIEAAVAAGELELNVMEPVIARHLLDGLRSAGAAARLLAERCVDGMQWDHEVVERHLSASFQERYDASLVIGYDAAASNREEREP
jgi:aspartate ammonia-lyase